MRGRKRSPPFSSTRKGQAGSQARTLFAGRAAIECGRYRAEAANGGEAGEAGFSGDGSSPAPHSFGGRGGVGGYFRGLRMQRGCGNNPPPPTPPPQKDGGGGGRGAG